MTTNLRIQNVIRAIARLVKHQSKNNDLVTSSTDKVGIGTTNLTKRLTFSFRKILLAFLVVLIGGINAANPACALCVEGATKTCFLNGKPGTQECLGDGWGPCEVEAGPKPVSGTLRPKYYILTVVYAPPGTQGSQSSSSVTYGSDSTTGSTVSVSSSFKQDYSVSASYQFGTEDTGTKLGASFSYNRDASNDHFVEIKKSTSSEISDTGPSIDGIDHDHDAIYLWLNPIIELDMTATTAVWRIDNSTQADIQYLYVGWLKNPSQIPPGVAQRLQAHGITTEDYSVILKADPFANGMTTIDPQRFQSDSFHTTFPYEPPKDPGESVPTMKFSTSYSSNGSSSSTIKNEYTVGVTASGSFDFLSLAKAKWENKDSWTWTSIDTNSSSTGTTESASVTVGGPAYGYTGPTDLTVYYDVIYKTFLFAPIDTTLRPALRGSVKNTSGNGLGGKEVIVIANGTIYRTFTNAKGEYHIYGNLSGPLFIHADSAWKLIPRIPLNKKVDILLP